MQGSESNKILDHGLETSRSWDQPRKVVSVTNGHAMLLPLDPEISARLVT